MATTEEATKKSASGGTGGTAKKSASARKSSDRPAKKSAAAQPQRRTQKMSASAVAGEAARQLRDLTGREPESVTGLERTDDGWQVRIEVVESRRIPDSADILALYDVEVDAEGDLLGYRRVRRYPRGRAGEE